MRHAWRWRLERHGLPGGWWIVVRGEAVVWCEGPFPTTDAWERAVHRLFVRWRRRAQALGGTAWRPEGGTLAVSLPEGIVPRGALSVAGEPCSRVGEVARDAVE